MICVGCGSWRDERTSIVTAGPGRLPDIDDYLDAHGRGCHMILIG